MFLPCSHASYKYQTEGDNITHKTRVTGRYMPMWDEILGALKVFVMSWVVLTIIFTLMLGSNTWAFYGAVVIGFLISIVITVFLSLITGARHSGGGT